jgi:hypothetical protein
MHKIETCLPTKDNNGNSVEAAVTKAINAFSDMALALTTLPGNGLWRGGEGTLFSDPVVVLTAVLPPEANLHTAVEMAKKALLQYKKEAAQESVVMAVNDDRILGDAEDLIEAYGGCTQLSEEEVFSFANPTFL